MTLLSVERARENKTLWKDINSFQNVLGLYNYRLTYHQSTLINIRYQLTIYHILFYVIITYNYKFTYMLIIYMLPIVINKIQMLFPMDKSSI